LNAAACETTKIRIFARFVLVLRPSALFAFLLKSPGGFPRNNSPFDKIMNIAQDYFSKIDVK
jgi:hypothetical protein